MLHTYRRTYVHACTDTYLPTYTKLTTYACLCRLQVWIQFAVFFLQLRSWRLRLMQPVPQRRKLSTHEPKIHMCHYYAFAKRQERMTHTPNMHVTFPPHATCPTEKKTVENKTINMYVSLRAYMRMLKPAGGTYMPNMHKILCIRKVINRDWCLAANMLSAPPIHAFGSMIPPQVYAYMTWTHSLQCLCQVASSCGCMHGLWLCYCSLRVDRDCCIIFLYCSP
jgi:hypothetical protein